MNSSVIIELYNGTNFVKVDGRIDGAENFTVTLRRNDENGGIVRSYSSELTFYDDGYQILKAVLIDPVNGFNNSVNVNVYDSCCGKLVFEGVIEGAKIDWCEPKCSISANIIEREQVYSCIQSTLIYDNTNGFLQKNYLKLKYCIEHRPIFMHILITLIGLAVGGIVDILIYLIGTVIALILSVIYGICSVVNAIPGVNLSCQSVNPGTFYQGVQSVIDAINAEIIPCGRYHPTAYVRDYINNVCEKCGLNFKSSILNEPGGRVGSIYYNLGLFSAFVKGGRKRNDTDATLIQDNLPIETLETLFNNYLKPIFNAEYQVIGNDLIFERKDYFYNTNQWIDVEQLLIDGRIENDEICYNWIDKKRPAYGVFKYSSDAQEYVGNEALSRYKDIVEWNANPTLSSQKGDYELIIGSSPVRTMTDGVEQNSYQEIGQLAYAFLAANYGTVNGLMALAQDTAFNYKFILMYDNGLGEARLTSDYPDQFIYPVGNPFPDIAPHERVNYPMWFKEGVDQVNGYQNNLYSLFHYIDNPRLASSVQYSFKFTFKFECGDYNSFDYYKTVRLIRGGQVRYGKIDEITVDFTKRTMQVTGKVN